MNYKHKNQGNGIITIFDSFGRGHTLHPGGIVSIDKKMEGNGVIVIKTDNEQVILGTDNKTEKNQSRRKKEKLMEDDE